jgi:hypothetical protein
VPVRCACQRKPGVLFVTRCGRLLQRFGENKVGKIAMGVLGMTLVACLVYSAATEERQYAAYTPSTGLAERQVKQGDITKMEMQLAAKEVSSSSSDSRIRLVGRNLARARAFLCAGRVLECRVIGAHAAWARVVRTVVSLSPMVCPRLSCACS